MFPRILPLCRLAVVGAALGVAAGAQAQIAAKSPFMPSASQANAPTVGAPLEYRGYLETSDGLQFRIYDPARKTGTWVKLNERNPDFDVLAKQHDDDQTTLTVEHQGKTLTLAERKSKVVSSGVAGQAMPPPPQNVAPNVAPAVTQAVVLNPTPADEQRRLEAVAAEVARRRALREQATQQVSPGGMPQAPQPQPARNFLPPQPQSQPANSQNTPRMNRGLNPGQSTQQPAR